MSTVKHRLIDIQMTVDAAPLLSRKCKCGSTEFRRVVYPEQGFQLLSNISPCPSCKVDLMAYNQDREKFGHFYGMAICLECKRLYALA